MAVSTQQIDAAIDAVLKGGQSVSLPDGSTFTAANLAELRRLREDAAARELAAAQAAAGRPGLSGFYVGLAIGRGR
ncbi:MAG: hypothetical protein IOD15_10995 [Phycisphaerales bacterium]|nr:hypothetical protein [Phycisphaerales bacterium]